MFTRIIKYCIVFIYIFGVVSCAKKSADELTPEQPLVEFSVEGEYRVKTGYSILLEAKVHNAVRPVYAWKLNGKIVSTELTYNFQAEDPGEYFFSFRVDAENGTTEKQVKVSVLNKIAPEINVNTSIIAWAGADTKIAPVILYGEDADYTWRLNGAIVGTDSVFTFNSTTLGQNILTLKVSTADGEDIKVITLTVLPPPVAELFFDDGRYRVSSNSETLRKMTIPLGKTLVLAPVISNIEQPQSFQWTIDGAVQSATSEYLYFTPDAKGTYLIVVTESGTAATATVEVECTEPEGTYFRPITAGNKAAATTAFDYIPAPGQFINYQTGTTYTKALQDLQVSLNNNSMIHIGAYGGYYIVGFDHSVEDVEGKADLRIDGNAFPGWSEPGIVWVMQDENGNGLPDDTWYELKGSETGKPETKQRYAITYYKPNGPGSDVLWTDNLGRTGSVDYNGYHNQPYYFPMFIQESHYTLVGTCLASTFDSGVIETSAGYAWGYVDNVGDGSKTHFWIEDAIKADGSPANLKYIDFVKVHTGMTGKGSAVGEISTESYVPVNLNF